MFKAEVIGNLGADVVVKESNGKKFAVIRVAHTDKWTDEQGKEHAATQWVDGIISNAESKVIPFLKAGTKIFMRGNATLRVYSSPKDRMMKAGLTINVLDLELCGGVQDEVPRELILPDTLEVMPVSKYYWVNTDTSKMKKDEFKQLVDRKGCIYVMDKQGFVSPLPPEEPAQTESTIQQ